MQKSVIFFKQSLPEKVVTLLVSIANEAFNKCMRDCRQANIGRQHSLNYIFSKNAKVPTREELNASKDPHSAKKRSTGLKKKTPDQMKLHNFFEMNVMER